MTEILKRAAAAVLFASGLGAQTPAKDALGRNTPQSAVFEFLEACHSRDYRKASRYLDLRKLSAADRMKQSAELAMQLEDILDDTPFELTSLSTDPEGDA